jgi:translocation and assembly module TamA
MVRAFAKAVFRRPVVVACLFAAVTATSMAHGDPLEIDIQGIDGILLENVESRIRAFKITGNTRLSRRRLEKLRTDAERRAASALRPFGYYRPVITGTLQPTGERSWRLKLQIDRGQPVVVQSYHIEIVGPGADDPTLIEWKEAWPLKNGSVLNQATWEEQKTQALNRAEAHGYLSAGFTEHSIQLDLLRLEARLALVLDTGPRSVMGEVLFKQDVVLPGMLERIPRFSPGQPYDDWLLEQFRLDLWRTGFFESVEVVEERRQEETPPRVNLIVRLEPRKPNTYQGSLGFGSDSGYRVQANWTRHRLSRRGDSLDLGFGWKQKNDEFNFRASYRHPRRVSARQYWTADAFYRTENQSFKVQGIGGTEDQRTVARGDVYDYSLRPGWLRVRDLARGYQQIFERWFAQYLREESRFRLVDELADELSGALNPADDLEYPGRLSKTLSLGVSWDWPVIRGNAFETVGHNHRAWIFTSNSAWGSDTEFTQAYLSSRWNAIWRDRWKFLLRGEVGYTDARVEERLLQGEDGPVAISITELPFLYRFKAGGSQSVRGYGFENLSNNNIGSNHILTLSAEVEMLFRKDWSLAAFIDAGNAFNDWSNTTLKKGVGLGIRWYSIAGPIRLDIAQAIDEPGNPWRLHFTIGSPLL